MSPLNIIVNAVRESFEAQSLANEVKRKRFATTLSEVNNGIYPNIDATGRCHYPVSGYQCLLH